MSLAIRTNRSLCLLLAACLFCSTFWLQVQPRCPMHENAEQHEATHRHSTVHDTPHRCHDESAMVTTSCALPAAHRMDMSNDDRHDSHCNENLGCCDVRPLAPRTTFLTHAPRSLGGLDAAPLFAMVHQAVVLFSSNTPAFQSLFCAALSACHLR